MGFGEGPLANASRTLMLTNDCVAELMADARKSWHLLKVSAWGKTWRC